MEDRREEEQKHPVVLVGATTCPCGCGAPNIMLDINGQRASLSLDEMLVVFDQIGCLMEGFGMFEDGEDDAPPLTEGSRCLH